MPASPYDSQHPQFYGDVAPVPVSSGQLTVTHINSNNSQSSFITTNVSCAASVQTVITSLALAAGVWQIDATVSASVNAALATNQQEIAIIPSGGAASVAYASCPIAPTLHGGEAFGTLSTIVTLTTPTTIQLVGNATANSPFTALVQTSGSSYNNATGLVASPTV